jgi:hypothetical protein
VRTPTAYSASTLAKSGYHGKSTDALITRWQEGRPWLKFGSVTINGEEEKCLFCNECKDAGADNVFAHGQRLFALGKVKAHAKVCVLNKKKPLPDMFHASNKDVDSRRCAFGHIAYNISHTSTASELQLKDSLLAARYAMLELDSSAPDICREKAHNHGASEMTYAFSSTLENEQLARIQQSPLISIGCDETTDVSTQSALIVYIYFLHEGAPAVEFFTLRKLSGGKAADIKDELVSILKGANLLDKLICLGSDGCSTMLGCDGGVGKLMQDLIPQLLCFHCMAHKLHLAVGTAFATEACHECDRMAGSCHRLVSNSPKRSSELDQVFKGLNGGKSANSILRLIVTRWLSRHGAYASILDNGMLEAILQYTTQLATGGDDPRDWTFEEPVLTAKGKSGAMKYDELAAKLRDFKLVGFMHFLCDICEQVNILSKVLQSSIQDGHIVLGACNALVASIKDCYPQGSAPIKWGTRAGAFIAKSIGVGGACNTSVEIGGQAIPVSAGMRDDLIQEVRDVAVLLVHELEDRMPDNAILDALLVFDPRRAPALMGATYGDPEIDLLCTHFSQGGPVKLNGSKLRSEWLLFKYDVLKSMAGASVRACYKRLHDEAAENGGLHPSYEQVFKLMAVACLLPLSNAVSERGFSFLGNIKSDEKSRMSFLKADARLRCAMLGPEMSDHSAVRVLVAKATAIVFKNAVPERASGGRASGVSKRRKRAGAKHLDAAAAISGTPHAEVPGDGSASPPQRPPFPTGYNARAEVPLGGKLGPKLRLHSQIFYLYDDNKGGGLSWHKFNINATKVKSVHGADGASRNLRQMHRVMKGTKGEGPGKGGWNYLDPERYGPVDGCWVVVEKLKKTEVAAQKHSRRLVGETKEVPQEELEKLVSAAFEKLWGDAGVTGGDIKKEVEKRLRHQLLRSQEGPLRVYLKALVAAAEGGHSSSSSSDSDDSSSSNSSDGDSSSGSDSDSSDDGDSHAIAGLLHQRVKRQRQQQQQQQQ